MHKSLCKFLFLTIILGFSVSLQAPKGSSLESAGAENDLRKAAAETLRIAAIDGAAGDDAPEQVKRAVGRQFDQRVTQASPLGMELCEASIVAGIGDLAAEADSGAALIGSDCSAASLASRARGAENAAVIWSAAAQVPSKDLNYTPRRVTEVFARLDCIGFNPRQVLALIRKGSMTLGDAERLSYDCSDLLFAEVATLPLGGLYDRVAISPNGEKIAYTCGRQDCIVRIFDTNAPAEISQIQAPGVSFLEWLGDSNSLAIGRFGNPPYFRPEDAYLRILDFNTGMERSLKLELGQEFSRESQLKFSPNGEKMAITGPFGYGHSITVSNTNDPSAIFKLSMAPGFRPDFLSWSANGQFIAVGSNCPDDYNPPFGRGPEMRTKTRPRIEIFSSATGHKIVGFETAIMDSMDLSSEGPFVAAALINGNVAFFDATGQARLQDSISFGHLQGPDKLAWSPNGKYIAFGFKNGQIRIWDIEKREEIECFNFTDTGPLCRQISWSRDGRTITSVWDSKIVVLKRQNPIDWIIGQLGAMPA